MSVGATATANTRVAVEMTLVWGFVGVRSIDLLQAAVAAMGGSLAFSTNVAVDVLFLAIATLESIGVSIWLVRRRSVLPPGGALWVDVAFACVALAGMTLYSRPEDRIASWVAWSFALTLSTAGLLGLSLRRFIPALLSSLVLSAVYAAVTVLPALGQGDSDAATGLVNATAYPAFTVGVWVFVRFVRRLADEADSARLRVAELERDRGRAVVHDMLGYLRLDRLLRADEAEQTVLVRQALNKYKQMRSYVDGTDQPGDLESCLQSVVEIYPKLDLQIVVNLDAPVTLDEEVAVRLRQALDTALANVQQNAPLSRVVVSAESDARNVLVTVVDDGPGFDTAATRVGFGISETLGRQLATVHGRGRVESRPGLGTQVEITLPWGNR